MFAHRCCTSLFVSVIVIGPALPAQLPGSPVSKGPTKVSAPAPRIASIGGTPATTTLTVIGPATAARLLRFEVSRWNLAAPNCCRNSAVIHAQGSEGRWVDHDFPLSGVYVYSITSVYDDGTRGTLQIDYTRPEPVNPASLKAVQVAGMEVELTWPEVAHASLYQVWGKGLPSTGFTVLNAAIPPQTATLYPGVREQMTGGVRHFVLSLGGLVPGDYTWSVGSFYEPPSCTSVPQGQPCQKVSTVGTAFTQAPLTMPLRWRPPENQP